MKINLVMAKKWGIKVITPSSLEQGLDKLKNGPSKIYYRYHKMAFLMRGEGSKKGICFVNYSMPPFELIGEKSTKFLTQDKPKVHTL